MEKKQYISPKTVVCQLQSEGIMYATSIGIGEDWGDAKKQNFFDFDEYSSDDAEPVYPQAQSAWEVDEKYDQW